MQNNDYIENLCAFGLTRQEAPRRHPLRRLGNDTKPPTWKGRGFSVL